MAMMLGGLNLTLVLLVVLILAVLAVLLIRKSKKTDTAAVMSAPVQHESGEGTSAINENQSATPTSNPMMKRCPVCGAEIAKSAKSCPKCGAKNKKPFYKSVWFVVVIIIIAIFAYSKISAIIEDNNISRATVITNSGEVQELTATEIKDIYETNKPLFEKEYAGADITVTSAITEIGGAYLFRPWFDCEAYILLDASDFMTSWFRPVTEEYALTVNVGDTVTVSGKIAMATVAGTDIYIFETMNSPY